MKNAINFDTPLTRELAEKIIRNLADFKVDGYDGLCLILDVRGYVPEILLGDNNVTFFDGAYYRAARPYETFDSIGNFIDWLRKNLDNYVYVIAHKRHRGIPYEDRERKLSKNAFRKMLNNCVDFRKNIVYLD